MPFLDCPWTGCFDGEKRCTVHRSVSPPAGFRCAEPQRTSDPARAPRETFWPPAQWGPCHRPVTIRRQLRDDVDVPEMRARRPWEWSDAAGIAPRKAAMCRKRSTLMSSRLSCNLQSAPGIEGVVHLELPADVFFVIRIAKTVPDGDGFQPAGNRV